MFLFCSVKKINKSYQITKSMPLSSCSKPLFSSEAKCSHTNKTHFHKKSFADPRFESGGFRTQKWPTWLLSLRSSF